jgi:hypothetical protein
MVSVTDATYPNLVSGNIFLNSGTLQNGQTVTFRSTVDNVGGVNTPASSPSFHDNFTYQWNGTGGAWQPIGGHIPHNMMTPANAVRTDTSVGLPLGQTGTLYIQHCVDSQSQVDESASGETGNCVVSMPGFNVTAAPVGLSITSCNATPSPAEEGELVTWQANVTGGTPPYNYSWSGTGGLSGGGNPKTITYATAGTKNAQVTVTDNASGSFGPFNCTALTVEDAPPTVNFKVCDDTANDINDGTCEDEKSVAEGTPLKLIWTSDADACDPVPPPNFSTGSSANGSDVVTAFPGETKYKILCRRGTGATENVVDVSAGGPPTIDADPDRVRFNEPFDIEWDVTDSDLATCTLSGGTLPATPPSSSGSLEQTIGGETTFSITCEFGTASVTVELIPGVFES